MFLVRETFQLADFNMILSYTGSKRSLVGNLEHVIKPLIAHVEEKEKRKVVFGDLFCGSGFVSNHFKNCNGVGKVVSCDLELYSYVLTFALNKTVYTPRLAQLIDWLNSPYCQGVHGLISEHYAPHSKCNRMFFTYKNANMIDGIRIAIHNLFKKKQINFKEFMFLLASLITSTSKIANTAGTFRAYLKHFCSRSLKRFVLLPIHKQTCQVKGHHVVKDDATKYSKSGSIMLDIVYIDPPYNSNHYGAYYGFFNYLCMYDKNVEIKGVAGVMSKYNKSAYGFSNTAQVEFQKLLGNLKDIAKTKYAIISYNNNGAINIRDLVSMGLKHGSVTLYKMWHKNYKPHGSIRMNHVTEYLFVIDMTETGKHIFKQCWLKL